MYIWKNGLVVRTKNQIEVLTKKVEMFSTNIERSGSRSSYLKDMLDLNTELTGYFSAITDNVNVRDLFDFLTICFYEYEHFFKENREQILMKEEERNLLLPLAHDIVFTTSKTFLSLSQTTLQTPSILLYILCYFLTKHMHVFHKSFKSSIEFLLYRELFFFLNICFFKSLVLKTMLKEHLYLVDFHFQWVPTMVQIN